MSPPSGTRTGGDLLPGAVARDAEGWITARPPQLVEVLRRIVMFPWTLMRNRDLVGTSVKRELQARFQGTLLGWAWPLVSPVFLFLVYYFIFTKLLQVKFPELPPEQESAMGIYMFVGILVWAAFGESLIRCCSVIVDNGNLIKKLVFPAELMPLNLVCVNLVTMMFGIAIYLIAVTLTPVWAAPDPVMLLWIPVFLVLQAVFTYGLGLALATLNVFLRDTAQVMGILVTVWMFVTPIFWAPELIPDDEATGRSSIEPYLGIIQTNPLYHLVFVWRSVLMHEQPGFIFAGSEYGPSFYGSLATFALWALGSFVVGYALFIVSQRRFADEV